MWETARGEPLKQWLHIASWAAELIAGSEAGLTAAAGRAKDLVAEQREDGSFYLMPCRRSRPSRTSRCAPPHSAVARCRGRLPAAPREEGTWRFAENDIWITAPTVRPLHLRAARR
ncbi:hypothetical protein AB4039_11635 [Streptomyces sp. M-16]|uniref:hypothetical protein n=1 Tax=Streptomyces sp. M-16 TaxID=3233040 RepID=UPI002259E5F6